MASNRLLSRSCEEQTSLVWMLSDWSAQEGGLLCLLVTGKLNLHRIYKAGEHKGEWVFK